MKNLIIVLFALMIFSCSMVEPDYNWYAIKVPAELKELDHMYTKESLICCWVTDNIDYKFYANGFHPAQQTLNEKCGNCANRALIKLALIYKITGEKGKLIYCFVNNGNRDGLHYTIEIDGYIPDRKAIKQIYEKVNFDDIAEYIYYRQ